jgi:hypothetical protein
MTASWAAWPPSRSRSSHVAMVSTRRGGTAHRGSGRSRAACEQTGPGHGDTAI